MIGQENLRTTVARLLASGGSVCSVYVTSDLNRLMASLSVRAVLYLCNQFAWAVRECKTAAKSHWQPLHARCRDAYRHPVKPARSPMRGSELSRFSKSSMLSSPTKQTKF